MEALMTAEMWEEASHVEIAVGVVTYQVGTVGNPVQTEDDA
jgi:hypothetical protein